MHRLSVVGILSLIFALDCGCAHTKTVKNQPLPEPKADKALVVVIRPRMMGGAELGMPVQIDGQRVGYIANNSYMYQYLEPGHHTLQMEDRFEWTRIEGLDPEFICDIAELNLAAGDQVFYLIDWRTATVGGYAPGMYTQALTGAGWIELTPAIAREDLAKVANSPTDVQYEQLKEQGLIEFERKASAR